MEAVDSFPIQRRESDMHAGLRGAPQPNPEERFVEPAIAREIRPLGVETLDRERGQGTVLKRPRSIEIADAKRYVIQHRQSAGPVRCTRNAVTPAASTANRSGNANATHPAVGAKSAVATWRKMAEP